MDTPGKHRPAEHIQVSDFDSAQQANAWRHQGAESATNELTAALRTAILLGDTLTLDRNQLFDGVYFLSLGPEGVAHALGLNPRDRLPLRVTCEPAPARNAGEQQEAGTTSYGCVPPLRGTHATQQKHEGTGTSAPPLPGSSPNTDAVDIDFQLTRVRADEFWRLSSARAALTHDAPHAWMYAPTGDAWIPGCGLTLFQTPLDIDSIHPLILEAQNRWAQAMADGRVAVECWQQISDSTVSAITDSLEKTRHELESLGPLTPLADALLSCGATRRKEAANLVDEWVQAKKTTQEEARTAMSMWSRAYYRAIAHMNNDLFLAFFTSGEQSELARSYGSPKPDKKGLKGIIERAFTPESSSTVRVSGELIEHMRVIAPAAFAQLFALTRGTSTVFTHATTQARARTAAETHTTAGDAQAHPRSQLQTQPQASPPQSDASQAGFSHAENPRDAMLTLALAAREAVAPPESYAERRFAIWKRIIVSVLLALALTVPSTVADFSDFLDLSVFAKVLAILAAALIGLLIGLPWEEISTVRQLRESKMSATLQLRSEETN